MVLTALATSDHRTKRLPKTAQMTVDPD